MRHARALGAESPEDLVHEALLKLLVHLPEGDLVEETRCRRWLWTVLRNDAISSWRQSTRARRLSEDPALWWRFHPPSNAAADLRIEALEWAVACLGPKQRQALELSLEGLSYAQLARALGVRQSTLGKRLHDARIRVRVALRRAGLRPAALSGDGCLADEDGCAGAA